MSLGEIKSGAIKDNAVQVYRVVNTTRVFKVLLAIRLWTFLVGMTLSFTVGVWWCRYIVPQASLSGKRLCDQLKHLKPLQRPQSVVQELRTRQLLFIGIMTSQKFLTTRAKGVYDTWGKNISGRLIFFAGEGNTMPKVDFPVVYLPVPDNVHPPQRKSLAMLRYIHDNYIDDFQWFIRADDDVYMRTRKLADFLRKFNSSESLLLGQAGVGKAEERGKLGLGNGDNFCIGGPGVIMSRGVLKKVTPHLTFCLNNTSTVHEDTEVGRCLRNFAGVMCPWAYEAKELFHQVYENQGKAYHGKLSSSEVINNAVTLHPIKDPAYMRRLHVHYLTLETQSLSNRALTLKHKLQKLRQTTGGEFPNSFFHSSVDLFSDFHRNNNIAWETFSARQIFSLREKGPVRWIHDGVRDGLLKVVRKGRRLIHARGASRMYHSLRFTNDILGYSIFHPVVGSQYIINLSSVNTVRTRMGTLKRSTSNHFFKFQQSFLPLIYRQINPRPQNTVVHFIVPLAGRLTNFRRFLASFENAFLRHDINVKLLVVYFPKLKDLSKHVKALRMYKMKYPAGVFHWLNVNTSKFQRGLALNLGSNYFGKNALLSFTDVDLVFQTEYLYRCRENTKRGEQVYFPIMFSQFHPNISRTTTARKPFTFHKDDGLWRIYSYGPVCIYSDDLTAVGGFNTTIKGWGLEDVEFFEKFVRPGKMKISRSPDRGLVHVYHKHAPCSPKSTFQQQKMCHDAKAAYLSSASCALDYLMKKRYLKKTEYF